MAPPGESNSSCHLSWNCARWAHANHAGVDSVAPGSHGASRGGFCRAELALRKPGPSRSDPTPDYPPTNFAETLPALTGRRSVSGSVPQLIAYGPALTGRRPALDSEVSAATTRVACPVPPPAHSSPGGRPGSSGRSSRSWALSSPGGFRPESRTSSRPLSATRFRGTSEGSPARVAAPSTPWASPGPRDRHLTRENVCQGYDLAG